jgi:hypothetical protein
MMIMSVHAEMDMLAYILNIPRTIRLYGMLKSGMNMFNGGAPARSYEANIYTTTVFGRTQYNSQQEYYASFAQRVKNLISTFIFDGVVPQFFRVLYSNALPTKYSNITFPYLTNLTIVGGVEGMMAPFAVPPNVKFVYPLSKNDAKLKETIPDDMKAFLDKHEKTLVVAFGTFLAPTNQTMSELVEFIRTEKDYAIIFAMRQKHKFPPNMFEGLD